MKTKPEHDWETIAARVRVAIGSLTGSARRQQHPLCYADDEGPWWYVVDLQCFDRPILSYAWSVCFGPLLPDDIFDIATIDRDTWGTARRDRLTKEHRREAAERGIGPPMQSPLL